MAVPLWNLRQKMEYPSAAVGDCASFDFSMPGLVYGRGDCVSSAVVVWFGLDCSHCNSPGRVAP